MVVRDPNPWAPDPFERMCRWELTRKEFVLHLDRPPHPIGKRWHALHVRGDPHLSTALEAAHDLNAVVCVSCVMIAFAYQDMAWTG